MVENTTLGQSLFGTVSVGHGTFCNHAWQQHTVRDVVARQMLKPNPIL